MANTVSPVKSDCFSSHIFLLFIISGVYTSWVMGERWRSCQSQALPCSYPLPVSEVLLSPCPLILDVCTTWMGWHLFWLFWRCEKILVVRSVSEWWSQLHFQCSVDLVPGSLAFIWAPLGDLSCSCFSEKTLSLSKLVHAPSFIPDA